MPRAIRGRKHSKFSITVVAKYFDDLIQTNFKHLQRKRNFHPEVSFFLLPLFQEQAVPLCLASPFAKPPFPSRLLPPLLIVKYDAAAVVLREY